jgi:hypothetical protein
MVLPSSAARTYVTSTYIHLATISASQRGQLFRDPQLHRFAPTETAPCDGLEIDAPRFDLRDGKGLLHPRSTIRLTQMKQVDLQHRLCPTEKAPIWRTLPPGCLSQGWRRRSRAQTSNATLLSATVQTATPGLFT